MEHTEKLLNSKDMDCALRFKRVTGRPGCWAHPVTMATLIQISSDKKKGLVGGGWMDLCS